jgi:type I restriction enzyme, S subunit
MPEIITDNLDLWSSALLTRSTAGRGNNGKLEAYGIRKLRELILELAVRGKLLPQDPNDEPASALLEKISKEKLRLIKEGKIKKGKPLPTITEEEMDYELPIGWGFVRLGDVAYSQAGFAFKSNFFNENSDGLPLIRIRDVGQPFTGTFYSGEYREEFLIEKGNYLISMDGEFRVSPWTNGTALLNQRVSRLIFYYENVGQRFIADSLQARLRELQGIKAYTTVDHLSGTQITEAVIGLPPLAEQHRIVAKVDELMALCDQLEQQQTDSIAAHQTLVASLLGTLTSIESQEEFSAAWARIASHFDTLFTTEASIDQLKQTILQLAVMGKLVHQDPNEEPVQHLLARIKEKQSARVKNKEIQKPKQATTDTVPGIEIPKSWVHRTLNELAFVTKLAGFEYTKYIHLKDEGEVPVIRAQNVRPFVPDTTNLKYIDLQTSLDLPRSALDKPSLLVTFIGAGIGDVCLFSDTQRWHLAPNVAKVEPFADLNIGYLNLFMNSPEGRKEIFKLMKSTAQPSLSMETIREIWVPIPPVEEQKRIVARIDELMALCDTLKARIKDAQAIQLHLADAIVEQAVC